jgi:protein-disulfide isomerase
MRKTVSERTALSAALIVVTIAVVMTVQNARSTLRSHGVLPTAVSQLVPDWGSYAQGGIRRGASGAAVTVIMFSDYECDYCASAERELKELHERHSGHLATILRHYPRPTHPEAGVAAKAAICANAQHRFDEMHELLFARRTVLSQQKWGEIGVTAGITDSTRFRACLESASADSLLGVDIAAGRRLRVGVTPTILINEKMYDGLPVDFTRLVEDAIATNTKGAGHLR